MDALDPIQAGEELADFLATQEKRCKESLVTIGVLHCDGSTRDEEGYHLIRLMWERDFWRNKALGITTLQPSEL